MKRSLLAMALACVAAVRGGPVVGRDELDAEAMLEAIAQAESGNNAHAVGPRGERGRCQFLPGTWRRYTNAEFLAWAPVDCAFTRGIERRHLVTVCQALRAQGCALEPALVAAAWRFGEHAAAAHVRADSARRTANLYWDLRARRAGP